MWLHSKGHSDAKSCVDKKAARLEVGFHILFTLQARGIALKSLTSYALTNPLSYRSISYCSDFNFIIN